MAKNCTHTLLPLGATVGPVHTGERIIARSSGLQTGCKESQQKKTWLCLPVTASDRMTLGQASQLSKSFLNKFEMGWPWWLYLVCMCIRNSACFIHICMISQIFVIQAKSLQLLWDDPKPTTLHQSLHTPILTLLAQPTTPVTAAAAACRSQPALASPSL